MLVILSPIVVSSFLHTLNIRPDKTVNYGELIEVKALQGSATNFGDDTIFRSRQLRGKWTLLTIDSGKCEQYCQDKLYKMRQVRLAQHTEKDRVQRVWLINDDQKPSTEIINQYEGTRLVLAKGRDLLEEFPYINSQVDHIYVIDPMGNLMMRYPRNAEPKKMVDDIKRLLKLSHMEH
jgi:cytochrome oxidase Cu insertion factor (SCO1/SenC/PrrC family)